MTMLTLSTEWVRLYNPHGAVILAYLMERKRKDADKDGWFSAPVEEFRADTGINLQTYTKWRRRFERAGLLESQPRDYKEASRYRLHLPS